MTLRLDDLDVPDVVLSVCWDAVGVDRRLAVKADGSAWLWSLADLGPDADAVGTWRIDLDVDTRAAVVDLASSVVPVGRSDGRLGFSVTAGSGTEWVLEGGDRAGEILAVVRPVLAALRAAPLAVARWTVTVARSPSGELVSGFSGSGVGAEPVTVLLDADGLGLTSADGTAVSVPAARMGLVTADVQLLDGLHQPAVLEPGRSGTCAVVLASETGPGGAHLVIPSLRWATLTGSIGLVGPWVIPGSTEPMLGFAARAEVRRPN